VPGSAGRGVFLLAGRLGWALGALLEQLLGRRERLFLF
jgi:hypothetical protein